MYWLNEASKFLTALDKFIGFTYFDAINSILSGSQEREFDLSPFTSLDQYESSGFQPLHYAIKSKSQDAVDWILSQSPPINSETAIEGWNPAHCAVIQNDSETLMKLMERGVNLNSLDQKKMTPLAYAFSDLEFEKWTNALDLDFNLPLGPFKRNYLHFFAKDDTINLLNWAIEAYPPAIDSSDIDGTTPLMLAAESGQVKATQSLLLKSSFYDQVDAKGRTAIHRAAAVGQCVTCKLLLFEPILNADDDDDEVVFVEIDATESQEDRHKSIALLFVQDSDGFSPLMSAVIKGHVETVRFLCTFPDHFNLSHPETDDTALHYAVQSNSPQLVSILLNASANPDQRNKAGKTPLDLIFDTEDPSGMEISILLIGL